ncbi:conserved protein of unknown function [Nitrosotalea devaniterrae]|uniref:Uncharacterized protein n=1 Tax=Nitrosotalea devaniterrae TaxID=1078905 RepID=A0A128A416_9ARCH|nr:conserved protein of unknown function [Candidatus Nitrosotalea devanaterra]
MTMSIADDNGSKAMVIFAIERTLLKIGKNTLEEVQAKLDQEYKCSIQDCYEHPEYLNWVLKTIFGTAYHQVILDMNNYLEEFAYQSSISEFLAKIK